MNKGQEKVLKNSSRIWSPCRGLATDNKEEENEENEEEEDREERRIKRWKRIKLRQWRTRERKRRKIINRERREGDE